MGFEMDLLFEYVKAFAVGGALCVFGQLLIDYTKLTPARILTLYVVLGVVLGAAGIVKMNFIRKFFICRTF